MHQQGEPHPQQPGYPVSGPAAGYSQPSLSAPPYGGHHAVPVTGPPASGMPAGAVPGSPQPPRSNAKKIWMFGLGGVVALALLVGATLYVSGVFGYSSADDDSVPEGVADADDVDYQIAEEMCEQVDVSGLSSALDLTSELSAEMYELEEYVDTLVCRVEIEEFAHFYLALYVWDTSLNAANDAELDMDISSLEFEDFDSDWEMSKIGYAYSPGTGMLEMELMVQDADLIVSAALPAMLVDNPDRVSGEMLRVVEAAVELASG